VVSDPFPVQWLFRAVPHCRFLIGSRTEETSCLPRHLASLRTLIQNRNLSRNRHRNSSLTLRRSEGDTEAAPPQNALTPRKKPRKTLADRKLLAPVALRRIRE